jgi:FkbM family methyltransferase
MKIIYGLEHLNIDVTDICLEKLMTNNIITIPAYDICKFIYFGDPVHGSYKKIFFLDDENNLSIFENDQEVIIDTIDTKLKGIQSKLKLKDGNFSEELPEQKLAVKYLTGNEKVLEIGGNIGRNSLIISYILNQNKNSNLVTLESNPSIVKSLIENRDQNNLNFHIENAALSKRPLIQFFWHTIPSDELREGFERVNIITWEGLCDKYKIDFDTLVLDCEGAFYYILIDTPEILNNIKLIIVENDYSDINQKIFIDNILKKNKFYVDHIESGGYEGAPCFNNFYEVWKKKYYYNT